jgi:gas vesicle protein
LFAIRIIVGILASKTEGDIGKVSFFSKPFHVYFFHNILSCLLFILLGFFTYGLLTWLPLMYNAFFLGAAIGAVAGAVAGILTAPKSGKETIQDIKDTTERTGKAVNKEAKVVAGEAKKLATTTKQSATKVATAAKTSAKSVSTTAQKEAKTVAAKTKASAKKVGKAAEKVVKSVTKDKE